MLNALRHAACALTIGAVGLFVAACGGVAPEAARPPQVAQPSPTRPSSVPTVARPTVTATSAPTVAQAAATPTAAVVLPELPRRVTLPTRLPAAATLVADGEGEAPTQQVPPDAAPLSLQEVVGQIKQYTVYVVVDQGAGSGISLGGGKVLTANHVVEGTSGVVVRFSDGRESPARVERTDAVRDLALLHVEVPDAAAANLRDARDLQSAEDLLAVGYPRSDAIGIQEASVTRGIFSARWQSPQGVWHVQTDTPINPGNSGGPLADGQGQVVGVITFRISETEGLNFAVASDEAIAFLAGESSGPPPISAQPTMVVAHPEFKDVRFSFDPRTVEAGDSFTISYELSYDGEDVLPVVLAAAIRPVTGEWVFEDPAHDEHVSTRRGAATYTRQFDVPDEAPPGRYDLVLGFVSEDGQELYALDFLQAALEVQESPMPEEEPAEAVRQFYALVGSGDYPGAWELLSPRFRSTRDINAWSSGYRNYSAVEATSVTPENQVGRTATVAATIDYTRASGGTETVQGTWSLIVVDGAWKLDALKAQ